MFNIGCALVNVSMFYIVARICSLYIVWNGRLIWPIFCKGKIYAFGFIYTATVIFIFSLLFSVTVFMVMLVVLRAIPVSVFLNILVIILIRVQSMQVWSIGLFVGVSFRMISVFYNVVIFNFCSTYIVYFVLGSVVICILYYSIAYSCPSSLRDVGPVWFYN